MLLACSGGIFLVVAALEGVGVFERLADPFPAKFAQGVLVETPFIRFFADTGDEMGQADSGADRDVEALGEAKHGDTHCFVGEFEGLFRETIGLGSEKERDRLVDGKCFERYGVFA